MSTTMNSTEEFCRMREQLARERAESEQDGEKRRWWEREASSWAAEARFWEAVHGV